MLNPPPPISQPFFTLTLSLVFFSERILLTFSVENLPVIFISS